MRNMLLAGLLMAATEVTVAVLPTTSTPELDLVRTIRTTPFVNNSSVSMRDSEGSAYVGGDNSIWLLDDNGRAAYEVTPSPDNLKRSVLRATFEAVTQQGGGPAAGPNRSGDLESMAYDRTGDVLYAFSGKCCSPAALPTAFRFNRVSGTLVPQSYQPLPAGTDARASFWHGPTGNLYIAKGSKIRQYNYMLNTFGPVMKVPGVSGILGMDSLSEQDVMIVTAQERLFRVNWTNKRIVGGWDLDLTPFGIRDSRAVAVIPNPSGDFDQIYVSDGLDGRAVGDPSRHAVFVFNVLP